METDRRSPQGSWLRSQPAAGMMLFTSLAPWSSSTLHQWHALPAASLISLMSFAPLPRRRLPIGLFYGAFCGRLVSCGHGLNFSFLAEGKRRISSVWCILRTAMKSIAPQQGVFDETCVSDPTSSVSCSVSEQNEGKWRNAIWNTFGSCLWMSEGVYQWLLILHAHLEVQNWVVSSPGSETSFDSKQTLLF